MFPFVDGPGELMKHRLMLGIARENEAGIV